MASVHLIGRSLDAAEKDFSSSGIVAVAALAGRGCMPESWEPEASRPTRGIAVGRGIQSKLTLG